MKPETRAKIQEALERIAGDFHILAHCDDGEFDTEGLRNFGSICERQTDEVISALAAEPDEPTVSKSVEELVDKIHDGYQTLGVSYVSKLKLTTFIQQFLDAQMAERDKWISVKERLPDTRGLVLVYPAGGITLKRYHEIGGWLDMSGMPYGNHALITHWKPLPEAPHEL